jgi:hypothetical protein
VAALTLLKKVPGLHEQKFLSDNSLDGKYQGIMLHGLGAYTRASIESDFVRHGVKYIRVRFFNNADSNEICKET